MSILRYPLANKQVLLFAPVFFGYEKDIVKGLENLGANVNYYDERPDNRTITKGFIRTNRNLVARKIYEYYQGILAEHSVGKFDLILLINPESISPKILTDFRERNPSATTVLYMWDSFKNKVKSADLIPFVDKIYSFDQDDCLKYKLNFRPLFYVEDFKENTLAAEKHDSCFVGTAHSDRYRTVKRLERSISQHGYQNCFSFFYISSLALFILRQVMEKDFRDIKKSDVSFRSMTKKEVAKIMHESKFIIDIQHPSQAGLTMRTFEALGGQKKIITTNSSVVNYDFYHPSNIVVVNREDPLVSREWLNEPLCRYSDKILKKYSLEYFLREITDVRDC